MTAFLHPQIVIKAAHSSPTSQYGRVHCKRTAVMRNAARVYVPRGTFPVVFTTPARQPTAPEQLFQKGTSSAALAKRSVIQAGRQVRRCNAVLERTGDAVLKTASGRASLGKKRVGSDPERGKHTARPQQPRCRGVFDAEGAKHR